MAKSPAALTLRDLLRVVMTFRQAAALTDASDRRPLIALGLLKRLQRGGFGLGDVWIGARLKALLDDAEFGRTQAAEKARRGQHGGGNFTCMGINGGHAVARLQCRQVRA